MFDPKYKEFANETELRYLEAYERLGSVTKVARELGVQRQSVQSAFRSLRKRAAKAGFAPKHDMTHTVPEGFGVSKVSTLYNEEGQVKAQWVQSKPEDVHREELFHATVEALAAQLPRMPAVEQPTLVYTNLLNLYTITDYHVGALAWHQEGGADWDLRIAERTLNSTFGVMIDQAPRAYTGMIAILGDFLHSDGLLPVTPSSGHVLDQDGRFSKIVAASVNLIRYTVQRALEKHQKVVLLLAEGNHDMASSVWLRTLFKALYEYEPRVEVIDTPLPYYAYQHGRTMLAFHHGHLAKNANLPLIFAAQYPVMWGDTVKRYCHTGHRHHIDEKEYNGMLVTQHSTLAARDAYAARGGWMSERQAMAITYHDVHGQVARSIVTPEMLSVDPTL